MTPNARLMLILCSCIFVVNAYGEVNWSCFRGPDCGIAEDAVLPTSWSTTENVKWQTPIPGRAWSCPVVWGDKIFLTSVLSKGQVEDAKKGLYFGGDRNKVSKDMHLWMVYCVDFNTGDILWEKCVHTGKPAQPVHIKNTYASETPIVDGQRLYAYFGNLGIFCFDHNGKEIWQKKIKDAKVRYNWGTATSPVLHDGSIYILNDNEDESYLLALDSKSGDEIFKTIRDEKSNWATPYIWKNSKRTEIITCGTGAVRSYDLKGNELWSLGPMSVIAIPTPVAKGDLIYLCSGYVGDRKNRPVYAVRAGASGDISPKEEQDDSEYIAWRHKFGGPYNPSPILYGEYFYILYDRGGLSCYNAGTGKILYENKQIAKDAKAYTVSPWANNGKLFFLSEDGDTFVVKAGPEFEVLQRNPLNEMAMSTPATLRASLIIRTLTKLYRISK